jgi:CHAT domain-containing protein/cytochrome c-type biogenesis protein CcmH/NrfG
MKIKSSFVIVGLIISLIFHFFNLPPLNAQQFPFQQAQSAYLDGQYHNTIELLENYLKTEDAPSAQTYQLLGEAYQKIGQTSKAIHTFDKAIEIYRTQEKEDDRKELALILNKQAQAYITIGQNQKAISLTSEAYQIADSLKDSATASQSQGILGNAYFMTGDDESAITAYKQSLKLAQSQNLSALEASALNNLSNASESASQKHFRDAQLADQEKDEPETKRLIELAKQKQTQARDYALKASATSQSLNNTTTVRALLNAISFTSSPEREHYRQKALSVLEKLPDSQPKVYLLIDLAKIQVSDRERLLEQAIQIAQSLGDYRGVSFALGELGRVYEQKEDYKQALEYTQQAQLAAGQVFAYDSLYRWWWQLGRIYRAIGQRDDAIAAYRGAIASLQKIRGDTAIAAKDFQLDFRDEVEPIYRDLLALKLESKSEPLLQSAKDTFASLQLSELESFFGDICVEVTPSPKPQQILTQTNAVAINTIILPQTTYLLLQLPDGSIRDYSVFISAEQLKKKIERWREELEDPYSGQYLTQSQALYDLLKTINPKTLVFIGDGLLRNVPMAALHDGKQFLVEKYAVAVSLGLDFTSVGNKLTEDLQPLAFGLSDARPPLKQELPYVELELQEINRIAGGNQFYNGQFTWENFRKQLLTNESPIVHIATHGRFSGSTARSFIQTYDRPANLNELESLLNQRQQSLELLVLSACQTSAGNDRSTFGLAGIAIRTGVRSVLASLWFSNDAASVDVIAEFYNNLKQGMTRSEALRQAQLKQISKPITKPERHPSVWSNMMLIGDWS